MRKPLALVCAAGLVFLFAGAALAARPDGAPAVPVPVADPAGMTGHDAQNDAHDAQNDAPPIAPRYLGPPTVSTPFAVPIAPALPPARDAVESPAPSASADHLPPGPPTTHR